MLAVHLEAAGYSAVGGLRHLIGDPAVLLRNALGQIGLGRAALPAS
jgi:hypothetical protein